PVLGDVTTGALVHPLYQPQPERRPGPDELDPAQSDRHVGPGEQEQRDEDERPPDHARRTVQNAVQGVHTRPRIRSEVAGAGRPRATWFPVGGGRNRAGAAARHSGSIAGEVVTQRPRTPIISTDSAGTRTGSGSPSRSRGPASRTRGTPTRRVDTRSCAACR